MTKIAIVGAGGYVFPLRLVGDILSFPELRAATLSLMDIDPGRLETTAAAARDRGDHRPPRGPRRRRRRHRHLPGRRPGRLPPRRRDPAPLRPRPTGRR